MATYKVIQDIEAEDKLVGPLTLRQFVYAGATLLCLYLCFIGLTKGLIIILPIFLPIAFVTGFFAFPWGREQPTEIWALAKIRFMIKPRRRIWDQSGIKELVTITAPKQVEHNYTNGLSQSEVKSRLKALADTIDSRGWAIKNVNVNLYAQQLDGGEPSSDRLVGASTLPQDVSNVDIKASDDILDEQNNPVAQQFEAMIEESAQTHRQQVIKAMDQAQNGASLPPPVSPPQGPQPTVPTPPLPAPRPPQQPAIVPPTQQPSQTSPPDDYWFMQQPPAMAGAAAQIVAPGTDENNVAAVVPGEPTADEKALAERLRAQNSTQQVSYSHLHTIQPIGVQQAAARAHAAEVQREEAARASAMTAQPDPAIIALASNNDLNVATIARQAKKQQPPDEVIISLH